MEHVKSRNIKEATAKIAQATGFSRKIVKTAIQRSKKEQALRQQILSGVRVGKLDLNSNYLTFNGLLPLELPDGVRIVVLPDLHAPAHHEGIMWAIKEFLHDYQPHLLILIGDVCDAFGLSAWPKGPRVPSDLNNELWEARKLIDELIEISGCERCFIIMGNHEDRARRWLMNYGATISRVTGAASHEPILSFHEMMGYKPGDKVTFIYDMQQGGGFGGGLTINEDLKFLHGYIVRPRPGAKPSRCCRQQPDQHRARSYSPPGCELPRNPSRRHSRLRNRSPGESDASDDGLRKHAEQLASRFPGWRSCERQDAGQSGADHPGRTRTEPVEVHVRVRRQAVQRCRPRLSRRGACSKRVPGTFRDVSNGAKLHQRLASLLVLDV